jgi:hypothetical protein
MTILVAPKRWQKTKALAAERTAPELTAEEQRNARAALVFLRKRLGGWRKLAAALRCNFTTVRGAGTQGRPLTAGLALRAARTAGVSVEDVLSGAWPPDGACAHCGSIAAGNPPR